MKKSIFSVVVLAVALMTATSANAQVRFGMKAGLNLSSLSLSGEKVAKNLDKSNQAGFFIGPTADVTIPLIGIGADASLLYDQRSGEIEGETYKMHYISIPINVKYTVGFSSLASAYLATGPQFSFNIDKGDVAGKILSKDVKAADFFWNVGAGVTLLSHLRVGYTYNIPISCTINENGVKLKNKTHQIALTYLF